MLERITRKKSRKEEDKNFLKAFNRDIFVKDDISSGMSEFEKSESFDENDYQSDEEIGGESDYHN